MTILAPMPAEEFNSFAEACIAGYAADNIAASRWPRSSALARAESEFRRLLPQGLNTPNNFIFNIQDEVRGEQVGTLWFGIVESEYVRAGYIYSIMVKPEFRGRGHAKAALELVESMATSKGLSSLALHVFSFNSSGQALYRSLGYGITGFNMLKPLRRDDA